MAPRTVKHPYRKSEIPESIGEQVPRDLSGGGVPGRPHSLRTPEELTGGGVPGTELHGGGVPGTELTGGGVPGTELHGGGVPGTELTGGGVPGTELHGGGVPGVAVVERVDPFETLDAPAAGAPVGRAEPLVGVTDPMPADGGVTGHADATPVLITVPDPLDPLHGIDQPELGFTDSLTPDPVIDLGVAVEQPPVEPDAFGALDVGG